MTARRRFAALFFACWALYGACTSLANLRAYTLQQMAVESIVTHGTFTLGHSRHASLQPLGDAFVFEGRTFAAKQPGQFVVSAVPYAVLKPFGLDYERDYDRTAAWVTWLSAGLLAALAVASFDRLLRVAGFASTPALLAAAAFGLGSHAFAYAGIAHHDVIATALLVFAARAAQRERWLFAGWWLGSVLFVSMLPAPVVAVGLAAACLRRVDGRFAFAWRSVAGFALGVLPLLAYNAWYFGSPFMPANVAGDYADTFPAFDVARIAHHANAYFGTHGLALWRYAPALALGAVVLLLRPAVQVPRAWLLAACAAQVAFLCSIETLGTCQYGPRYLLPLLPAFAVGIACLLQARPAWRVPVTILVAAGLAIALVGALGGTMHCRLDDWALPAAWNRLARFEPGWLPLRWFAWLPALAALALFSTRQKQSPP